MKLKKLDYVIILVLIVITILSSLGTFLLSRRHYDEKYVVISVDGKLYRELPLDKNTETINIKSSKGTNVVQITGGKVRILEADCPDKICIKDGSISEPGQMLVCLPNKVVVQVKGQKKTELDDTAF